MVLYKIKFRIEGALRDTVEYVSDKKLRHIERLSHIKIISKEKVIVSKKRT